MPREEQTEGNETPGKARSSICALPSKGDPQAIRGRAGNVPFYGIFFSDGAIRRRPHFERGIFRALYGDNCTSSTRSSPKMLEIRLRMRKAFHLSIVCAKFGIFMGTCFSDTVRANAESWFNRAPAVVRV